MRTGGTTAGALLIGALGWLPAALTAQAQTHFPGGFDDLPAAPGRAAVDERKLWVLDAAERTEDREQPFRQVLPVEYAEFGDELWVGVTREVGAGDQPWPYKADRPLRLPAKAAPYRARAAVRGPGSAATGTRGWPDARVGAPQEYRRFFDDEVTQGGEGSSLHFSWGNLFAGYRTLQILASIDWDNPEQAGQRQEEIDDLRQTLLDLGVEPLARGDFPERGKLRRLFASYALREAPYFAAQVGAQPAGWVPGFTPLRELFLTAAAQSEAGRLRRGSAGFVAPEEAREVLDLLEICARVDALRWRVRWAVEDQQAERAGRARQSVAQHLAQPGPWQEAQLPASYYDDVALPANVWPVDRFFQNWEGVVDGRKKQDPAMSGTQYDAEVRTRLLRLRARTADFFRLNPEQTYEVTGAVRLRHAAFARVRVGLEIYAREEDVFSGPRLLQILTTETFFGDSVQAHPAADGWQTFALTLREFPPEGYYYKAVCLVDDLRRHGDVWFDGLKVQEALVSHFHETFNGAPTAAGLPEGWVLDAQDPARDYLHHGLLRLDDRNRRGAAGRALHVLPRGFNVRVLYDRPRRRPLNPDKTYTLRGWVRTRALDHQQAFLEVQLYDAEHRPVRGDGRPASGDEFRARSAPAVDTRRLLPFGAALPDWVLLERRLEGLDPRVRFLTIALVVESRDGRFDQQGEVWFDDLELIDEPTVRLTFLEAGPDGPVPVRDATNVLPLKGAGALRLRIEVRGLERQRAGFSYRLGIEDLEGREVFRYDRRTDFEGPYLVLRSDEQGAFTDEVALGAAVARRGFYRLRFTLTMGERMLTGEGGKEIKFALVDETAAPRAGTAGGRPADFGLVLRWRDEDGDTLLDEAFAHLGVRDLKLAVWDDETASADPAAQQRFARQGRFLATTGLDRVTAVLGAALRGRPTGIAPAGLLPLLADPAGGGGAEVRASVRALGADLSRFQLGADADGSFAAHADPAGALAPVLETLHREVPASSFVVPLELPALAARASSGASWPTLPEGVEPALYVPAAMSVRALEAALAQVAVPAPFAGHAVLEALAFRPDDPRAQALDLAQKAVVLRARGVTRVFLADTRGPRGVLDDNDRIEPLFVAYRVLNELLSGFTPDARTLRLRSGDALASYLFQRPSVERPGETDYLLALWPRGVPDSEDLYLGRAAVLVDLDGNRTRIPGDPAMPGRSVLRLSGRDGLRFITGINGRLLSTYLDTGFGAALLASRRSAQTLPFSMTNHFAQELKGAVTVQFPEGWVPDAPASVARFPVVIAPGATFTRDLTVHLPLSQIVGRQAVQVEADFAAGEGYRLRKDAGVEVQSPLALPALLPVSAPAALADGFGPREVRFLLRNADAQPQRWRSTFNLPPRFRSPERLPILAPGEEAVLTFPVPSWDDRQLDGQVAVFTLREQGGDRFVNARYRFQADPAAGTLALALDEETR